MFVVFLLKISLLQLSSSLLQKYGYRLFPGSYSIPRKLLRHQSSVTEIVGFEAEVKILLRSKDMDRLGDFLMSHAGLTADMYSNNRFFTNIVFNALLSKRKKNVVYTLIENLETNQKLPQIDTIHILISYAWKSSDARAAELLFSKYFSAKLKPNSRTLNIMMEGYRVFNDHSKVLQYYNLFAGNSILPDSYTYSTLVRIATNPTELLSLVNEISNNKHVRSPPLVRCIIETLGAFGMMAEAINMTQYLTGCDSIEFAEVSGDALMIALMRNCDTVLDKAPEISSFNYSCNCESIGNELFLKGSIKCGPKGINAVFNALQKKIRALLLQNHSNLITETEIFEIRDALFNRTMGLMTSSLTGPNISWPLPINGRVCDSIIRSYMDDCSKAKFALKELVVFAKKADALSNGSFAEITEKALEALMFVAGANYRPDIGLETAITARKRGWSSEVKLTLLRSYARGKDLCTLRQKVEDGVGSKASFFFNTIMFDNYERNMEIELGALLETNQFSSLPIKRIRFQLDPNREPVDWRPSKRSNAPSE